MTRTKALEIREKIESASQHIPEAEAYDAVWMYPVWTEEGTYTAGKVWSHEGKLWRCRQKPSAPPLGGRRIPRRSPP